MSADISPLLSCRPVTLRAFALVFALGSTGGDVRAEEFVESSHDLESFWDSTILLEVSIDTPRARRIHSLQSQTYELADGQKVRMRDWYSQQWRDLSVSFLTSVSDDFGLIWGMGLGDSGPKYRIEPSFRIGFYSQARLDDRTYLALKATIDLGGLTQEYPCTADYGAIGGVQMVNCRLAASELPPEETLGLMLNDRLAGNGQISLTLVHQF